MNALHTSCCRLSRRRGTGAQGHRDTGTRHSLTSNPTPTPTPTTGRVSGCGGCLRADPGGCPGTGARYHPLTSQTRWSQKGTNDRHLHSTDAITPFEPTFDSDLACLRAHVLVQVPRWVGLCCGVPELSTCFAPASNQVTAPFSSN